MMAINKESLINFRRELESTLVYRLETEIDKALDQSFARGRLGTTYNLPQEASEAVKLLLKLEYEKAGWTVELKQEGETNFGVPIYTLTLS